MGLLDFLTTPKWKEAQKPVETNDNIEPDESDSNWQSEDDYWYIDENEKPNQQIGLSDFFELCIEQFTQIAQSEEIIKTYHLPSGKLLELGEKMVMSYMYDRYIVHRRKKEANIYYSYLVELAIDSGIVMANMWLVNPTIINEYADKIIEETPQEDIAEFYGNKLPWAIDMERLDFYRKIEDELYELAKWYYKIEDFDEYIKNALLAAYCIGISIYNKQNQ